MTATNVTPPRLHWAIVLLLTVATLGIFYIIWMFVQARWIKRIDPESNATSLLVICVVLELGGQILIETSADGSGTSVAGGLLLLAGTVIGVVAFFSMRRSMLDYFNRQQPQGLRLSAALTFFLGALYLQHHMTRIAKWKETGVLPPQ